MTTPTILTSEESPIVGDLHVPEIRETGDDSFYLIKLPDEASLDQKLVLAQQAIHFVSKLRDFVLRNSRPNDWMLQNGNPYFCEAGCNRFAGPFGIYEKELTSFSIDANGQKRELSEKNMFEGDIRFFFFSGVIGSKLLGFDMHIDGGTSLEDGFKSKTDLLFYYQKAKANFRGRAIRKITGLENLTVDDLEKAGIKLSEVKQVNRVSTPKADTEQAKKLWDMLLKLNDGDQIKAEDALLKTTTSEKYAGKRRPSQLTEKQMEWILPKVEKEYNAKFGNGTEVNSSPSDNVTKMFLANLDAMTKAISKEDYQKFLQQEKVTDVSLLDPSARGVFLLRLKKYIDTIKNSHK